MVRFYLSPSRIARYYYHECDRFLRYSAKLRPRTWCTGGSVEGVSHKVITASASQVRVSDREEDAVINKSMDALVWLRKQLESDDNDLLREMVRSFC